MVEPKHPKLSIVAQCRYHKPMPEAALNHELMTMIDKQFMETPWYGSRQMARHLVREGH
jgi:putative transposase